MSELVAREFGVVERTKSSMGCAYLLGSTLESFRTRSILPITKASGGAASCVYSEASAFSNLCNSGLKMGDKRDNRHIHKFGPL